MGRFTEGYPQSEPYKWWNWHDSYGVEQGGVERRRRCSAEDTDVIVLAHIMAMPVEELLIPVASGAGAGTVIWLAAH